MGRWIALAIALFSAAAAAQAPNSVLLVAKPELADPNFHETVVLVTQAPDASTVGVILNRPTVRKHEKTGETIYSGGPVMRGIFVVLFRWERELPAAFPVMKDVYLSMHPDNLARVLEAGARRRVYEGFSGWIPNQLQSELQRDAWYVLPASEDIVFREDTAGLWRELLEKARGARTERNATRVAMPR